METDLLLPQHAASVQTPAEILGDCCCPASVPGRSPASFSQDQPSREGRPHNSLTQSLCPWTSPQGRGCWAPRMSAGVSEGAGESRRVRRRGPWSQALAEELVLPGDHTESGPGWGGPQFCQVPLVAGAEVTRAELQVADAGRELLPRGAVQGAPHRAACAEEEGGGSSAPNGWVEGGVAHVMLPFSPTPN